MIFPRRRLLHLAAAAAALPVASLSPLGSALTRRIAEAAEFTLMPSPQTAHIGISRPS